MSKYHVIWIDDEWETMNSFIKHCRLVHQIEIHPFRTRKAGMDELERNLSNIDAVLLDAKMYDESENEQTKLTGLRKAKEQLERLSIRKRIPYFISTGQTDLLDNETFEESFGKYYSKGLQDEELIKDMLDAIQNSPRNQIKTQYSDAISALEYIDTRSMDPIIDILECIHETQKQQEFKAYLYYTQLRLVMEYIFRKCHFAGILPDECIVNDKVNINQSYMFLIGKDALKIGYRYGNDHDKVVPSHIGNIMNQILYLGNIKSHTTQLTNEEESEIRNFFSNRISNSKYIIFSLVMGMCEVAIWFAHYINSHSDYEANKCKWVKINEETTKNVVIPQASEEIIGKVEQDDKGNYHVRDIALGYKVAKEYIGKTVKLRKIIENKNEKSKTKYPLFAYNIDIVLEGVIGTKNEETSQT